MTQFATVPELEEFLGREIPSGRHAAALRHLTSASSKIQDEARQTIELVLDDEIELSSDSIDGCELQLPERPVLEVSSIAIGGTEISGFISYRDGRVILAYPPTPTNGIWPPKVVVTYSHGYALSPADIPEENPLGIALVPEDVKDICLELAAASMLNPEAIRQEAIGQSYSATYVEAGLTRSQRRRLRKFRRRVLS